MTTIHLLLGIAVTCIANRNITWVVDQAKTIAVNHPRKIEFIRFSEEFEAKGFDMTCKSLRGFS